MNIFKNNFTSGKSLLIFLIVVTSIYSQNQTEWSKNLVMYEVNVRQYTEEGTFEAFESHLERLQELGVGILWFMPIHPIGEENRLGTLGSYYSVKDYYGVNSEFGTLEDFKELVSTAHNMGFYVILDWVANHTAWDNPLTLSHPEYYTKDDDGNFMPPAGTGWTDVIDLDYSKEGLREYMIDAMKYWVTETDIDGFRCDAASFVPNDFWERAITELKEVKPEILMLAEANGVEFQEAGFDMTFAWNLYGFGNGVLQEIADGTAPVSNANFFASEIRGELSDYSENHTRLYFTSNHDENSWHGTVFERFGNAAEQFAVVTQTINGMPLIYSGQESGLNKRLEFFEKDQINWRPHPLFNIYKALIELKKENRAMWNGTYGGNPVRVLTDNNPDVYAFIREKEDDKVFTLFNFTDSVLVVTPTDEVFEGKYVNLFSNDTVYFTEGSEIELGAWGYKVYKQNSEITSVDEQNDVTHSYALKQNYPNPFNPSTTIEYTLSKKSNVKITIYNSLGETVDILVNKIESPGSHIINFDGSNLPSGVYFYNINAGGFSQTKKLMLLK